jgi:hypothetical protein
MSEPKQVECEEMGLEERWIEGLAGRTKEDDDGQVFKLILMTKRKFWS